MKKIILVGLTFSSLNVLAANFPTECETFIKLNREASSLNKNLAEKMGDLNKIEKQMKESWDKMNKDEQKQAIQICQANNEQIRKIIQLLKKDK